MRQYNDCDRGERGEQRREKRSQAVSVCTTVYRFTQKQSIYMHVNSINTNILITFTFISFIVCLTNTYRILMLLVSIGELTLQSSWVECTTNTISFHSPFIEYSSLGPRPISKCGYDTRVVLNRTWGNWSKNGCTWNCTVDSVHQWRPEQRQQ